MGFRQGRLFADGPVSARERAASERLAAELAAFDSSGRLTEQATCQARRALIEVPTYTNEFWTAKQRAAHSLQEISYRACFKPQLPEFFISRLTEPGGVVYDPFMGRGTTPLAAALAGRRPAGTDINPLSRVLVEPRLDPPTLDEVAERLESLDLSGGGELREDLLVFYHPETLRELTALRAYLLDRERRGELDRIDRWIRMVAVNRLTGHSPGFFSVYTMPPNQAVSLDSQRKINARRQQQPPRREVPALILRKSRSLLADCGPESREALVEVAGEARLLVGQAADTPELAEASVDLVVTSPPFLDVVQYAGDNWLRCWFCGIEADEVPITMARRLEDWERAMTEVMVELRRVVRPGGHIAFEVGEVRGGSVRLEQSVIDCGAAAGLEPRFILVQDQQFTKTANCWGVQNNRKGTNSHRVVVLLRGSGSESMPARVKKEGGVAAPIR